MIELFYADCLEKLKQLPKNSIDSLITDPPAGINFMNKDWDKNKGGRLQWITWMTNIMRECHRVLKPGAHGLVWSIPRTSHWTGTALEFAGFEVRDVVTHLFGSGFPKSLDVSKAIDKKMGAKRQDFVIDQNFLNKNPGKKIDGVDRKKEYSGTEFKEGLDDAKRFLPATEKAKQWEGWGTALKPACELWWLVRKPLEEKTVAENVLKWGCGGLNIDGSRIKFQSEKDFKSAKFGSQPKITSKGKGGEGGTFQGYTQGINATNVEANSNGRFPAHLVLSHNKDCTDERCSLGCAVKMLNDQSLAGGMHSAERQKSSGASRFFYVAKASASERNAGLEGEPKKVSGACGEFAGDGRGRQTEHTPRANHHPTAKPIKLMSYLIKLITPPDGIVLDPFMGSGSTGVACVNLGFHFIGIEKEKEYFEIASQRIKGNK